MSTATSQEIMPDGGHTGMPLRRWLWLSYLRAAIIPLLFIEITFLGIYWISNTIVYRENIATVSSVSNDFLQDVAKREAMSISQSLQGISNTTALFAAQTRTALQGEYTPSPQEKERYAYHPGGSFYTRYDNGTTASYYSGIVKVGPEQVRKVWRLSVLDPLMMDIKNSTPAISSLYFNSFDSYNRIYPYFDVQKQYPPKMDIPSYNFYYEADERHNPTRRPVWTDAYIDPAGHGWMVSSIAPVWSGPKLEGVVGIDITLETIINRLMTMDLPWGAYAMLVDRQGRIIALPPQGEKDFALRELTKHQYKTSINADTFKPEQFNIRLRTDTRPLAQAMAARREGNVQLKIKEGEVASFAHIAGPGWSLVVLAPTSRIYADANDLRARLQEVGYFMIAGLLLFYVIFFVFLARRARAMSTHVARPLGAINDLVGQIAGGNYRQQFNGSQVKELDDLGHHLVDAGHQLGDAHDHIMVQERLLRQALARQKQVNEEQHRFIRIMSHEVRTPLAIIDSAAQLLDRRAERMTPDDLQQRSRKIRRAVQSISVLMQRLVRTATSIDHAITADASEETGIQELVRELTEEMIPPDRLHLELGELNAIITAPSSLTLALRAVLDNALRYSPEGTPVTLRLAVEDDHAILQVEDQGCGIHEEDLAHVTELFYRGGRTADIDSEGLGLYVARKLIESEAGKISITPLLQGVRVTFEIPVSRTFSPA